MYNLGRHKDKSMEIIINEITILQNQISRNHN
jgi:hypothetical protein